MVDKPSIRSHRFIECALILILWVAFSLPMNGTPLDPRGQIHIPIGLANTLDSLKTFVEAEGNFSPGFGSYGIYFWVYLPLTGQLAAPTQNGIDCEHGLHPAGYLIPWSVWKAGSIRIKTELCEVVRKSAKGPIYLTASRATLENTSQEQCVISFYVALRGLGPAGGPIRHLSASDIGDALMVDSHPALISQHKPSRAGVSGSDNIGDHALAGKMPLDKSAASENGNCSGALRFDLRLAAGEARSLEFICPVLPGRRAVGHRWDGVSTWAQFDLAKPNPSEGGILQPDPGLDYYRKVPVGQLFKEAAAYWQELAGRVTIRVPDRRWSECYTAIIGHAALTLNEGASDVAVINYNVFNRDGVYLANILEKAGQFKLAATAIDYFLSHPFNGRIQPEADNPGQILWIMGEHWRFTHDHSWLKRVYPAAQKLAAMIRYYRTTPGPHWVSQSRLDFAEALPMDQRQELKPGSCDGFHPEYTEAFDVAGLRAAALLAEASGQPDAAAEWRKLAADLFASYHQKFGGNLAKGYGSYSVLWPCRLYPLDDGAAVQQFNGIGAQKPTGWRYFPLARAHQGLLAGNRLAACETLATHLDHEQMRGWYAFDEGGDSGVGGWNHVRTTWRQGKTSVAMPHGWAIAELQLLLRDSLVYEDNERLVLFAGIPPDWFSRPEGMQIVSLPTHYGLCSLTYQTTTTGARLVLSGSALPPKGFILRLPPYMKARITSPLHLPTRLPNGDFLLPAQTKKVLLEYDSFSLHQPRP